MDKKGVQFNGELVNNDFNCTVNQGQTDIPIELAEVEFRKIELTSLM